MRCIHCGHKVPPFTFANFFFCRNCGAAFKPHQIPNPFWARIGAALAPTLVLIGGWVIHHYMVQYPDLRDFLAMTVASSFLPMLYSAARQPIARYGIIQKETNQLTALSLKQIARNAHVNELLTISLFGCTIAASIFFFKWLFADGIPDASIIKRLVQTIAECRIGFLLLVLVLYLRALADCLRQYPDFRRMKLKRRSADSDTAPAFEIIWEEKKDLNAILKDGMPEATLRIHDELPEPIGANCQYDDRQNQISTTCRIILRSARAIPATQ